jgi:hypothetical protein
MLTAHVVLSAGPCAHPEPATVPADQRRRMVAQLCLPAARVRQCSVFLFVGFILEVFHPVLKERLGKERAAKRVKGKRKSIHFAPDNMTLDLF